jgi:phosphopantothenoylcysteine decarboxylase/phosphopantothenate--cysteine ligase
MYLHPATQVNLEQLAGRGVTVIAPGQGDLASHGEHGIGRLAEPPRLLEAVEALLTPATWSGLRVLVTTGGTREPIDSVRFLGNRSSGRMGFALAADAARRGAEVTVIAANVAVEPPAGVRIVAVETAAELAAACEHEFPASDVLLMAAAVADFRPASPTEGKIKKSAGPPTLELEATDDVLSGLASARRPGQVLVGFAAEHGAGAVSYGRDKLERKGLDMVVVNDVSGEGVGFDAPDNQVTIVSAGGAEREVARTSKKRVARVVLDEVERVRSSREESGGAAGASARSAAGI